MTHPITRRDFALGAGAAALAAPALARRARAATGDKQTLRFIAQSDLRVLDPIWTTAYITRNHGYMVFDTLFALDDKFQPQPQMVGDWEMSKDRLQYRFALRDGLKFHDGQKVRGADCVASIRRWMARDGLGQSLAPAIADMQGGDDKSFSIRLKTPFPLLIAGLAKVSSLAAFVMPERLAKTDPFKQVTEMVGSGPFKFVAAEYQPGNKVVYVKNPDYVPRKEPPSWASGGKVVKVERVEWLYVPDHATAAAALGAGEADWWENPPLDLVPVLAANPDIRVEKSDPLGIMTLVRLNWLYRPFDNVKMRQAVLAVANQSDFLRVVAGDAKNWKLCPSFFACGTPMESKAGSEALSGPRDYEKAKQLIREAGYKGEKIITLDAVDQPNPHAQAVVAADIMKRLGLNVEIQSMDWGTLVTRRASRKPPAEGGWNVFGTGFVGADGLDPTVNLPLRANGDKAWFGWPSDTQIEDLVGQWLKAADVEERQEIAAKIQRRAFEVVPYIPTGLYTPKTAYRDTVKGIITAPAFLMWNVEKG